MNTDQPMKVLCIDDHPMLSEGMASVINGQPDMQLVASASTGREGILRHRELKPDITLTDLRLPDLSGIDVMIAIQTESPTARIVLLTMFARDVEIQRALRAGAHGYLLKSMPPDQIVETIRQVHRGKKCFPPEILTGFAQHLSDENLSEREVEVLHHVAEGARNRDIGEKLFIAEETVKVHLKRIMRKLNAKDRTEALTIAVRRGIMEL